MTDKRIDVRTLGWNLVSKAKYLRIARGSDSRGVHVGVGENHKGVNVGIADFASVLTSTGSYTTSQKTVIERVVVERMKIARERLQQMARDQGVDPEELNFEGTDIERTVNNRGTTDAMVREFMDRCRKDLRGLPHKTIVFAVSHTHAKRLYESFNRLYPELQRTFAPLMRFRVRQGGRPVEIDLPDRIADRSWIIYGPTGEGTFADSYREQVEALVKRLADELPPLAALKEGKALSDAELNQIAAALNQADLFVTEDTMRRAFEAPQASLTEILRHVLREDAKLPDREARINAAFDAFIAAHGGLRANQLAFLRAVKAAVLRHGRVTRAALSEPPLSRFGSLEALFRQQDVDELVALTEQLAKQVA